MMEQGTKAGLRQLNASDIPAALELSLDAGWNQTADDWQTLITLAPRTCLAIEVDGELAATATLLCYGARLAWIGMVLTRVKFRGRGLARHLLAETLKLAEQMKIESVKLDATEQGQPLYEKLGFRCEQPVERWERSGMGSTITLESQADSLSNEQLIADQEAFGADRSEFLKHQLKRSHAFVEGKSYLLVRRGSRTAYLGPCVCEGGGSARSLIEQCVGNSVAAISWDLLKQNRDAEAIARNLGFSPRRYLTRMVRGRDLRGKEESIYALGGFEFG
jgi:predicted GNAT family N-acyltransferase